MVACDRAKIYKNAFADMIFILTGSDFLCAMEANIKVKYGMGAIWQNIFEHCMQL